MRLRIKEIPDNALRFRRGPDSADISGMTGWGGSAVGKARSGNGGWQEAVGKTQKIPDTSLRYATGASGTTVRIG